MVGVASAIVYTWIGSLLLTWILCRQLSDFLAWQMFLPRYMPSARSLFFGIDQGVQDLLFAPGIYHHPQSGNHDHKERNKEVPIPRNVLICQCGHLLQGLPNPPGLRTLHIIIRRRPFQPRPSWLQSQPTQLWPGCPSLSWSHPAWPHPVQDDPV